jgi:hypothetical protein
LFRPAFKLTAGLEFRRGGALAIAFGTDPATTRGFRLDIGGEPAEVTLWELEPTGPRLASRVALPRGEGERPLEITCTGSRVRVRIGGRVLGGPGGFPLKGGVRDGRLLFGAKTGVARLVGPVLDVSLSDASRQRAAFLARRGPLVPLTPPRAIPLLGPVANVDSEVLCRDLPPQGAEQLERARRHVIAGEYEDALRTALEVAESWPEAQGPRFLIGAIRVIHEGDAWEAKDFLRRARGIPGALALLGDAKWMLGDLDGAAALFHEADDAGGLALVSWSRGNQDEAKDRVRSASSGGCRRAGQRLRLVEDLALLHEWKTLARARKGRVQVLSDRGRATAERVAGLAHVFLAGADGLLPGKGTQLPLTVLVATDPEVFAQWNERLGGVRWEEADGVYRPGAGLVVILDDDDQAVMRRSLQHELVHHLVFERGWGLPRGLEEGVAEYLALARSTGETLTGLSALCPGRYAEALDLARAGRIATPEEILLTADLGDGDRGRERYAQAWAIVHWLCEGPASMTGGGLAGLLACAGDREALRRHLQAHASREAVTAHLLGLVP